MPTYTYYCPRCHRKTCRVAGPEDRGMPCVYCGGAMVRIADITHILAQFAFPRRPMDG